MLSREKLEYQKRLRFLREAKAKTASEKLKLATKAEESDLTKRVETLGDEENRVPSRGETPKEYNEVPETRETSRVKKPVEDADKGDNILGVDLSDIEYAKIAEGTRREEDADQSLDRLRKRRKDTRTKDLKRKSQANLEESNLSAVLEECGCQEKNPFDAPEEEHQGYMLVQSLDKLADQADELSGMAHHEDNPEPWVEFKVNAAAEQLDAVHDYITYGRKHRPDMEHHMGSEHVEELYEDKMNISEKELKALIREAVKRKLFELSSFNKEELPGSGDMPALMEEFDDLLLEFSKKALDLHAKMVEEMKVDMLGGVAAPQMSPRIGERNRMLTVRAGILRKLAANCTAAIEAVRREG